MNKNSSVREANGVPMSTESHIACHVLPTTVCCVIRALAQHLQSRQRRNVNTGWHVPS